MICAKENPGTGDVVWAVRHMRKDQIGKKRQPRKIELFEAVKELQVP